MHGRLTHYHLGLAYLQMTPPDAPGGYWELSRAIASRCRATRKCGLT